MGRFRLREKEKPSLTKYFDWGFAVPFRARNFGSGGLLSFFEILTTPLPRKNFAGRGDAIFRGNSDRRGESRVDKFAEYFRRKFAGGAWKF